MKIKNRTGLITIAVIGMPRSGTTILTKFLNSLDGAIIVGEPHRSQLIERPPGRQWPSIFDTRYNEPILIHPSVDALMQINGFAEAHNLWVSGFKETWTPDIDPISLVKSYGPRIMYGIAVVRDPGKNYASMEQNTPHGRVTTSVDDFEYWYDRIVYSAIDDPEIYGIPLDYFLADPIRAMKVATGLEIEGKVELKQYVGSGDVKGRSSLEIKPFDDRIPSEEPFYLSHDAYAELLKTFSEKWK